MGSTTPYEEDFYGWTQATAALIRQQKWHDVDWEHLAEEVEALGKRDRRELESRLVALMLHLLKWRFQPARRQRGRSWRRTILEQRRQLAALTSDSPGLRPRVSSGLAQLYGHARELAAAGDRVAGGHVSWCLSLDRITNPGFSLLARLRLRRMSGFRHALRPKPFIKGSLAWPTNTSTHTTCPATSSLRGTI